MKTYTLDKVQDELIGKKGSPERDLFEYELQLDLIGKAIKQTRKERNLTQEELGKMVGVQKAQISRLENNAGNVTMDTLLRVFTALKAKVKFQVELTDFQFFPKVHDYCYIFVSGFRGICKLFYRAEIKQVNIS